MLSRFKRHAARYISNVPGWRTRRRIVVIESDDWGSIRMPSREVYDHCLRAGYRVDLNPYERYDALESEEDLTLLFDLLQSFKDMHGNHPVFTANCAVANPDFRKIKESGFHTYHYEPVTETFRRYPGHSKSFALWKKGLEENIFYPQFHAREHLNVSLFMNALKKSDPDILFAFDHHMPGTIRKSSEKSGNFFVEATRYQSLDDKKEKLQFYIDGLGLFEKLTGYASQSIIPPNYIWSNDFSEATAQCGVKYIQGIRKMREPRPGEKTDFHYRILGKVNEQGQMALVRNCFFEPAIISNMDALSSCLSDINIAFRMKKPAIISTHRANYIGWIDKKNRSENLGRLQTLLSVILKKWPDVEFMTSPQLGAHIQTRL